tara:strand:+ start:2953 stop:3177 length:225 start_codon:yes stop_codon:yes gene_type:complete
MNEKRNELTPVIMLVNNSMKMDTNVYDYIERYNYIDDVLDDGVYWMGSKSTNTMCNRLTLIGADKKHADDTKEK